jgi:hypothetical protein
MQLKSDIYPKDLFGDLNGSAKKIAWAGGSAFSKPIAKTALGHIAGRAKLNELFL